MCFIIVIMVIYIVAMMLMTMMTIVWNLTKILYDCQFSPLAPTHFLVNQLGEFDVRSGQQLLRDVLVFLLPVCWIM